MTEKNKWGMIARESSTSYITKKITVITRKPTLMELINFVLEAILEQNKKNTTEHKNMLSI